MTEDSKAKYLDINPVPTLYLSPRNSQVERNICFHNDDGSEIGKLVFQDGVLKFEGNMEESAIIFVRFVNELWGVKNTDSVQ